MGERENPVTAAYLQESNLRLGEEALQGSFDDPLQRLPPFATDFMPFATACHQTTDYI